jgi:hypothetical protein
MNIEKYNPMQGSAKYETTGAIVVDTFRFSATANTTTMTLTGPTYTKGSLVLGFVGKVTTAFTSTGTAKLRIGFIGTNQSSAIHGLTAVDAAREVIGPTATNTPCPMILAADDTFDFGITAVKLSAGAMDVHVVYVPPPAGTLDTTYKQYAST